MVWFRLNVDFRDDVIRLIRDALSELMKPFLLKSVPEITLQKSVKAQHLL